MKNHFLKFALTGICLLLPLACRAADEKPPVEPATESAKVEEKAAPIAPAPIVIKFALAQNVSGLGRVVAFSLTARNTTNEVQTLLFNTAQSFEMTVTQLKGDEKAKTPVWNWANGKIFTAAQRSEKLQPNESKTWTAVWQGDDSLGNPAPRGQYILEAIVMANGGLKAPPLLLDVRPEGIREMTPRQKRSRRRPGCQTRNG